MSDLVRIPWQPSLWLAPSTLALLEDASRRLGRNIYLNGPDAAWRSEARQRYLWDINGHNPAKANDPERGQRAHMRAAAVDAPTDAATRSALIAAGMLPDPNEKWHFNDPHWPFMPIIKTNTAAAASSAISITTNPTGQGGKPAPTQEEIDEMASITDAAIIRNTETEQVWLFDNQRGLVPLIPTSGIDINAAVEAHAKIFHIAPDNAAETSPPRKYVQLNNAQCKAWIATRG